MFLVNDYHDMEWLHITQHKESDLALIVLFLSVLRSVCNLHMKGLSNATRLKGHFERWMGDLASMTPQDMISANNPSWGEMVTNENVLS